MRKLHVAGAGVLMLMSAGAASAGDAPEDQVRRDQPLERNDQSKRDNPQERNDPARQDQPSRAHPAAMGGSQQARPDPEERPDPDAVGTSAGYAAELKKCDRLAAALKAQCIETVMKKFGQM